jgi:hypothetical protein
MYRPELFAVPTNHWQQQPPPFVLNPFMHWQQLLSLQSQANIMPWCEPEGIYGLSLCAGPDYQGMAQQYYHNHDQYPSHWQPDYQGMAGMAQQYYHNHDQYPSHWQPEYRAQRPPSSGPIRTSKQRSERFREAEAQYANHTTHESSGKVAKNRSTGTDPGMAWIGANNNPRVGKVWRTPSENPSLMADRNLT